MPKLTIENIGKEYEVPSGTLIPDFCDDTGAPIPFSCRAGACGTCRVRVLSGQFSPIEDNEKDFIENFIEHADPRDRLACQCEIIEDVVIQIVDSGNHNAPEGSPS